jgi:hypothetical protein
MTEQVKQWKQWMDKWRTSGLSQAEFCRRQRLKPWTFYRWKRKLDKDADGTISHTLKRRRSRKDNPGQFMEVAVANLAARGYEVVCSGGRIVCVPADFDADTLSRLIRAVEAAC